MLDKKYNWVKLVDAVAELHWQPNNMCVVEVENKKVTLVKHDNQIFAVSHKCPHASGIMADGFVDVLGNIICPLHRFKFSLANGRNTSGEGYYLKTYAIKQDENGIYIGFETGGIFSFR